MDNHYYNANGLYTGSAPAHEGSLPPANATRTPPPPPRPGLLPVWNGETWDLVEDPGARPEPSPQPEAARFFLTASGTYHREGCRYTKSLGGWFSLGEIRERKPGAKACAGCRPPVL